MCSTAQFVAKEIKLPQLPPAYLRGSLPSSSQPSKPSSRAKPERQVSRCHSQAPPRAREEATRDSLRSQQRRRASTKSDRDKKEDEMRLTNAWPSEQYRLWLGASNLPVAPLVERSKGPRPHLLLPAVECASVAERELMPANTQRKKGELAEASRDPYQQPATRGRVSSHAPQLDPTSPGAAPETLKLPSRMGRHSLEHYERMHCYTVDRAVLKLLNRRRHPALHNQLLEVQSTVRHPERRTSTPASTRNKRKGQIRPREMARDRVRKRDSYYSDVSPPPSPLCLQHSCTVTSFSI